MKLSPLGIFVLLLAVHYVGDFVLQTDWQAKNKSKNAEALIRHVGVYTAWLTIPSIVLLGHDAGLLYAFANGGLHLITDAVTSRFTAFYARQERWHAFFVVVGYDQLIHQVTLAATLPWWLS
jgi:TM2 domain-containing membrane protein YozV